MLCVVGSVCQKIINPKFDLIRSKAEIDLAKIMIYFNKWTQPQRNSELSDLPKSNLEYFSFPDIVFFPTPHNFQHWAETITAHTECYTPVLAGTASEIQPRASVVRRRIRSNHRIDIVPLKSVLVVKANIAEQKHSQAELEEWLTTFLTNAQPQTLYKTTPTTWKTLHERFKKIISDNCKFTGQ